MSNYEYDKLLLQYSRGEVLWEELVTILQQEVKL